MAPLPHRQVLQATSPNVVAAPSSMQETSVMSNNGHNHNTKQPRAVIMMRSPSQNTDDGDAYFKRTAESNSSLSIREGSSSSLSSSFKSSNRPISTPADEQAGSSIGLLASGLAWVQRSRESGRRKRLQLQAERQLQKIREAEFANKSQSNTDNTSNMSNPTFLQMRNFNGKSLDDCNDNSFRLNPPKLSKSGEGASAHLDWGDFQENDEFTVPKVRIAEGSGGNESPYILTPNQMHQIAIHVLPKSVAYCRWKRIYGLGRDGDSFDGCLRKIDSVSRTLMVVRTTKNELFGGYADSPWHSHAQGHSQFYGGAGACLFNITATSGGQNDVTKVFHWTGKNRYIQLCDVSRKMLAFGGGGNDGVFGLALEEDFQKGSTGPCDTFDNEQLCSEEVFEIVDLEFWEFLTGVF